MGKQLSLGIVNQFLGRQPAHALNESAFDLPHIDRRIDRCADIVQHVSAQVLHLAGQRVDCDLRAGSPISKVEERTSLRPQPVPVNLRRLVVAGMRQLHTRQPARFGKLAEAHGNVVGEHARIAKLDRLGRNVPRFRCITRRPRITPAAISSPPCR